MQHSSGAFWVSLSLDVYVVKPRILKQPLSPPSPYVRDSWLLRELCNHCYYKALSDAHSSHLSPAKHPEPCYFICSCLHLQKLFVVLVPFSNERKKGVEVESVKKKYIVYCLLCHYLTTLWQTSKSCLQDLSCCKVASRHTSRRG